MKWLKLDCDFRNDPKILCLIRQFGGKEACSFWTLLLSYVGANGMPECEIHLSDDGPHSASLIASFLCTKPKVALTMLSACAHLGLIQPERWFNDTVISIPNMLKRVDDYTRKVRTKSVQSPEKPAVEQKKNRTEVEEKEKSSSPSAAEEMFSIYNENRGTLPEVRSLTKDRVRKCNARRANTNGNFMADFTASIQRARVLPFCCGEGAHGWKVDFDFLIANDTNYQKILEGKYDHVRTERPKSKADLTREACERVLALSDPETLRDG